jgi:hypothetical protein
LRVADQVGEDLVAGQVAADSAVVEVDSVADQVAEDSVAAVEGLEVEGIGREAGRE